MTMTDLGDRFCDVGNCPTWAEPGWATGWVEVGGKDYCPNHDYMALTREDLTVRRLKVGATGRGAYHQEVVIKKTGEVIGFVEKLSWNSDALWEYYDTEGQRIGYDSDQAHAVKWLLDHYKKTCNARKPTVS